MARLTGSNSAEADRPGYIDPSVCATCHEDVAATYRKTGMGRSFSRPTAQNVIEDYSRSNSIDHKASGLSYTMIERDGAFFQRRHSVDFDGRETNVVEEKVDFIIGSGNHARTYLHRTSQGKLVELPVSWYTERSGAWAMSPGYDSKDQEDIRRAITPECLFCHNGYPTSDAGVERSLFPAKLPEGIDCQRCHGPGRAHVAAAQARRPDEKLIRSSIVNPQRLTRDGQMELCMQCHLETSSRHMPNEIRAYDRGLLSYRPGQPLADYKIYFDREKDAKDDTFEVAHAAYRLRKSKCFLKSDMTCLTCHDPHDIPRGEEATKSYVAACQSCHESVAHRVAMPTGSNCISCHMPKRRTEDVVHVVMTDHFIQRYKPLRDLLAPMEERVEAETGSKVLPYYPADVARSPKAELYLAVAQVNDGEGTQGLSRLQALLDREKPSAPEPYLALGQAYGRKGDPAASIHWFDETLKRRPEYLPAIRELVPVLFATNQDSKALEVLQRAVGEYPEDDLLLTNLGNAYLRRDLPNEAQGALSRALAANPERAEAHNLQGLLALRLNDKAGADRSFREAIRWQPDLVEAQKNLGTLLTGDHRWQEAEFHFRKALEANAGYADAHHGLGLLLILKGSLAEATAELREAARLQPASAQMHGDLADALAAQSQTAQAAEEYRRLLLLRPEQGDAHLGLGLALLREQRLDEAKEHLARAAVSDDSEVSQAAKKALEQLRR
ncbi:tetratricopeptide repeat protein [Granulicella sp. dw_53]|uniref:tetratricopeptide repeat protein n=1 Tax=Granulicella sp. dw_53 TaxID=2719792 RepID=UPI001BD63FCB|nr:tetratricopeptide repeat protein [Granulicella sp. dw_53]